MVLAERQSEIMRNGRRSRGPSPNGHNGTPDTSSDEDNSIKRNGKSKTKQSEYEEKIRVGRDYQAVCPELVPAPERKPELLNDRALLVWSPTKEIPDTKLEEYISVAKEKYGYNGEQALGMLFWHKHDLERAVMDLANFTPFPDEWTVEDKVLFEQAFQFHGKSFHRIRQMLPDKSIASLVKYYYSWKKTRHRQSVMDRQEKAKASKDGSENGSENGSNEESDNDDKDQAMASSSTSQDTKIAIGNNGSGTGCSGGGGSNGGNNISGGGGGSSSGGIEQNRNLNNSKKQQQSGNVQQSTVTTTSTSTTASASSTPTTIATATPTLANTTDTQNSITNNSLNVANQNLTTAATNNATATVTNNSNNSNVANNSNSSGGNGIGGCCTSCGVSCNQLSTTSHDKLCNSCYHHWRRTGTKRPTTGPYFGKRYRDRNAERHKRKPPRGMHINHDDIVALASSNSNQDELLANTEREIVSLLSQVQLNKQQISTLKRKMSESSEDLRPIEITNRINSRWTQDELAVALMGVKKFGKDFQAIADTLGTKTEAHIRTFFVNYRRRYNLDSVLKEFEALRDATLQEDGGQQLQQQQQQKDENNLDKIDIELKLTNDNKLESELIDNNNSGSSTTPIQQQKTIVDIIEIDSGTLNDEQDSTISQLSPTTIKFENNKTSFTTSSASAPLITSSTADTTATNDLTLLRNSGNNSGDLQKDKSLLSLPQLQSKAQKNPKDQDNLIMEIDLDSEASEPSPPKKIATAAVTSSAVGKELIKANSTA